MKQFQIFGLTVLLAVRVAAQEQVVIRSVEITEPQTPVYQIEDGDETVQVAGMQQTSGGGAKWFRIAADFETRPAWLDRLTLEYYVLLPAPDGKDRLFKGVVNLVDLPAGRGHLSDLYLHFNTWKRYYKRGNVEYAVIALIDGKEVAVKTNKREPADWWRTIKPQSGGLLNRLDTPFRIMNEELYQAQDR